MFRKTANLKLRRKSGSLFDNWACDDESRVKSREVAHSLVSRLGWDRMGAVKGALCKNKHLVVEASFFCFGYCGTSTGGRKMRKA